MREGALCERDRFKKGKEGKKKKVPSIDVEGEAGGRTQQ